MYKGLKKKHTLVDYVKLAISKNEDKCFFCLHNIDNYIINYNNKMDEAAMDYFNSLCLRCIHLPCSESLYWHEDNFKTLYNWEENGS